MTAHINEIVFRNCIKTFQGIVDHTSELLTSSIEMDHIQILLLSSKVVLTQTHPSKQAAKQYLLSTCISRDYLQLKVMKQKSYSANPYKDC
jgi:hypothetical protein